MVIISKYIDRQADFTIKLGIKLILKYIFEKSWLKQALISVTAIEIALTPVSGLKAILEAIQFRIL